MSAVNTTTGQTSNTRRKPFGFLSGLQNIFPNLVGPVEAAEQRRAGQDAATTPAARLLADRGLSLSPERQGPGQPIP